MDDEQSTLSGMAILNHACGQVLCAWVDAQRDPTGSAKTAMVLFAQANQLIDAGQTGHGLFYLDRAYDMLDLVGYTVELPR